MPRGRRAEMILCQRGSNGSFKGAIDDVLLCDRVLSKTEIMALP